MGPGVRVDPSRSTSVEAVTVAAAHALDVRPRPRLLPCTPMDSACRFPPGRQDVTQARKIAGGAAPAPEVPPRGAADRVARRILRLPVDAPRESIFGTESVFGRSIAISAVRCLITYVFLPLLAPVLKVSGTLGPVLGLVLGAVSMVAIVVSKRRFFAADHKYRWPCAACRWRHPRAARGRRRLGRRQPRRLRRRQNTAG